MAESDHILDDLRQEEFLDWIEQEMDDLLESVDPPTEEEA